MTPDQIPAGYWQDAQGRLIPEGLVKPIDKTRHDLVQDLIAKGKALSEQIGQFKLEAFADIGAFVQLSAEQYGINLGGTKGNLTLYSFDGRYKITRAVQEHISFDERLQAAKALIDQCISEWSAGSSDEIKALINDAFKVNQQGQINTARVLSLRKLDISHTKWQTAMTAIGESVTITGTKSYIRLYERVGATDQYKPINLDIANV